VTDIPFKQAADFALPFGKYQGKTLDEVAKTDRGLLYLDWLRGQHWLGTQVRFFVGRYLGEPSVNEDLEKILRR